MIILGSRFLLIDWLSFVEEGAGSFKMDVHVHRGGRIWDVDEQRE